MLHVFCRRGGTRCQDGSAPFGQLNPDTKGNFFGETESGSGIKGIVFELSPDGSHDGFTYRVIHKFCSLPHCADGHRGGDVMAIDEAGNVYGTAYEGGAHRKGVVYELSPVPDKKGWTEKVLYDFCTERKCVDGDEPVNGVTYAGAATGVPYDGRSPLYGVTTRGGNGNGIAFSLTPQGDGSWKEKVIFAFCKERPHCTSGSAPVNAGPLAIDSSGNIYGATASGGTEGDGLVYELHPAAKKWSETVLYNFCFDQGCDGSFSEQQSDPGCRGQPLWDVIRQHLQDHARRFPAATRLRSPILFPTALCRWPIACRRPSHGCCRRSLRRHHGRRRLQQRHRVQVHALRNPTRRRAFPSEQQEGFS